MIGLCLKLCEASLIRSMFNEALFRLGLKYDLAVFRAKIDSLLTAVDS